MINSINWHEQEFRLVLQFVSGLYHGHVYQSMVDRFNDLTMPDCVMPINWPVRSNGSYGAALHKAIGLEKKKHPQACVVKDTNA